jgi:hypothetical protein
MLGSIAILLATVKFAGGTTQALASNLAEAMHAPVVIASAQLIEIKPIDYDPRSVDSLAPSFRKAPVTLQPGSDVVFSDEIYIRSHFAGLLSTFTGPMGLGTLPDSAFQEGKVTFDTRETLPLAIGTLTKLKWTKPFTVNFLLQDLGLSIAVKDVPEAKFLDLVRKAAGGQWQESDGARMLVPDPLALRRRVEKTLTVEVGVDKVLNLRRALFRSAVINLGDTELGRLFQSPSSHEAALIAPGGAVAQDAIAYIEALAEREQALPENAQKQATGLLERVDSRRPAIIRLVADGNFTLVIPTIDPRTRKTGTTELH